MAGKSTRHSGEAKPRKPQTAAQLANLKGGSRLGKPNKVGATLKDMILGALDKAGGEAYLARQAVENPASFLTLVGKVLPLQLTGEGGGAIQFILTPDDVTL